MSVGIARSGYHTRMKHHRMPWSACVVLAAFFLPLSVSSNSAVQQRPYSMSEEREPCAGYDPLRRPFFGDTHVHTAYSFDAAAQDTRNKPADAYRFAMGERIGIQPYDADGNALRHVQLARPLDFTAVTDHAEFLGEIALCKTPGTWGYWHPVCVAFRWNEALGFAAIGGLGLIEKDRWGFCGEDGAVCAEAASGVWSEIQRDAENAYDRSERCRFTSFVAYEWTATTGGPKGQNLHRNVIFKNEYVPDRPISWIETPSAVDLWNGLEEECVAAKQGCDAITIPHNSNLSGGLMFETARTTSEGVPEGGISAEEAQRRARWEPLFEVMQHKGSSECDARADLWAEEEYCAFEKLEYASFGQKNSGSAEDPPFFVDWAMGREADWKPPPPKPNNFVRWALKEGLRLERRVGTNPFEFGLIAATDTHIAAPGLVAEKNHPGHGGAGMSQRDEIAKGLGDDLEFGPGGLMVVWAEENARDSLFASMKRKEVYATSGTRPIVRFFGGWDYPDDLCGDPELARKGYQGGVPMGGRLEPNASGARVRFLVSALQDSGISDQPGTPLERIQIVKGWLDGDEVRERVLDVAGGDNGASVDLATCQPVGSGAAELCSVWEDPDFDASQPSFYYARVLENPTCRWSQLQCLEAGVRCEDPSTVPEAFAVCCSERHRPVQQERAWTSPIWYTP
ncbi:MAG: hypothetical protein CL908_26770 [Deltaproteobacteria bacterium]|nr:hypothetical protein [Deltaproteobacteria bacterium]